MTTEFTGSGAVAESQDVTTAISVARRLQSTRRRCISSFRERGQTVGKRLSSAVMCQGVAAYAPAVAAGCLQPPRAARIVSSRATPKALFLNARDWASRAYAEASEQLYVRRRMLRAAEMRHEPRTPRAPPHCHDPPTTIASFFTRTLGCVGIWDGTGPAL